MGERWDRLRGEQGYHLVKEKDVDVDGTKITVRYWDDGCISFGTDKQAKSEIKSIGLTGKGAFRTMRTIVEASEGFRPNKLMFRIAADKPERIPIKKYLYERYLKKEGYELASSEGPRVTMTGPHIYSGPILTYLRRRDGAVSSSRKSKAA